MISVPQLNSQHGWRSECHPCGGVRLMAWSTFSVGIFKWVPRSDPRDGRKPGKVIVRVTGPSRVPERVDTEVQRIIGLLDADKYDGPKHVRVV